jgi:xylulokinase
MAAAFEGVAFALKSILMRVEALTGRESRITIVDHGDTNPAWLRLRASIYERPLDVLKTGEPTALGAMMLGAVGIGLYASLREAAVRVTGISRRIPPDADLVQKHQTRFEAYNRFQSALRDAWSEL